jgi:hypothetical protein
MYDMSGLAVLIVLTAAAAAAVVTGPFGFFSRIHALIIWTLDAFHVRVPLVLFSHVLLLHGHPIAGNRISVLNDITSEREQNSSARADANAK